MASSCEVNLLITIEIEPHVILLAIWISSSGDCRFKSFVHFCIGLVFVFLECYGVLYISVLWLQNIFGIPYFCPLIIITVSLFSVWLAFAFTLCCVNE